MLEYARLVELLVYDPETGIFRWRQRTLGVKRSLVAGASTRGYVVIRLDGHLYQAARLAWLYMTGEWPQFEIDHVNRNPRDNSWSNIREATRSQQLVNTGRKPGVTGVRGVTYDQDKGKFAAQINFNRVHYNLGRFSTIEEAASARNAAAECLHGDFMVRRTDDA